MHKYYSQDFQYNELDLSSSSLYELSKYLFAWQATQREDTYEETIKDLTVRLKDVSDMKLLSTTYNYKKFKLF